MAGEALLDSEADACATAASVPVASTSAATQIALRFGSANGRTFLANQRVGYPFHLGRSLHMPGDPGDMPTYYVQSCSGGIFEHDRLGWHVELAAGGKLHLSTAASTVVHSMTGGDAEQAVTFQLGAGSVLEYLPDPVILFPGARYRNRLTLRAEDNACAIAWDAVIAHDPQGAGRVFDCMESELRIVRACDDALCALDRYRIAGVAQRAALPGVTGEYACHGSVVVLVPCEAVAGLCETLRTALAQCEDVYAGAASLPQQRGAWVRVLARDASALRIALHAAWRCARGALGLSADARRK